MTEQLTHIWVPKGALTMSPWTASLQKTLAFPSIWTEAKTAVPKYLILVLRNEVFRDMKCSL